MFIKVFRKLRATQKWQNILRSIAVSLPSVLFRYMSKLRYKLSFEKLKTEEIALKKNNYQLIKFRKMIKQESSTLTEKINVAC